ncbi:MAG: hypothetical protein U0Z53_22700 [Blastocatellia bacterium]
MKRIALTLIFSLLLTAAAVAQDKPKADNGAKPETKADAKAAAMPTVDEILDKHVKAVGGKEAIEKLTTRTSKGTIELEGMGMNGTVETFSKAPNKNAVVITLSGFGTVNNVFDGSSGWSSDPMSGLRELSGGELAVLKRDSDFYSVLNLKKHFAKTELKGKEKVGSSDAWVIEATPAEGGPEKFYFDAASGLLIRHDAERDSPQGKMAIEIYTDDYKPVDGVKIPHTMRQVTPAFTLSIKLTEVKHNTPIDDAKFGKPSVQ